MNQLMSEQEAQPMEFGGATAAIRSGTRRPFKPPSSKRQQITAAEAIEIYKLRPVPGEGEGDGREPIAYARVDRRDRRACGLRESAAGVCSVLPPARVSWGGWKRWRPALEAIVEPLALGVGHDDVPVTVTLSRRVTSLGSLQGLLQPQAV